MNDDGQADVKTSQSALLRLAELTHDVRPDWDKQGILTALRAALQRQPPPTLPELGHAAINAAGTTTNRTPAVIPLAGSHWQQQSGPTVGTSSPRKFTAEPFICARCLSCGYTQRDYGECRRCGAPTERHTVHPVEQDEINRRGVALVKATDPSLAEQLAEKYG